MRRIRWAAAAASDLEGIRDYLRGHHPSYAQTSVRRLYNAARSLVKFPRRGRIGQVEGTRELVVAPLPYVIVYGVDPDAIHVFRVIHASQDWP